MNDFKWSTFLDGPIFLVASYFEALAIVAQFEEIDPNYQGSMKIRLLMFRATTIYFLLFAAQFMQQKELYVAIIQKQLLAYQQVQLSNVFQSQKDGVLIFSMSEIQKEGKY